MAIGTPTRVLQTFAHASGSAVSTTADAPAGSLIVIVIDILAQDTVSSVTLSSGDTPLKAVGSTSTLGTPTTEIWYVENSAHDLPSGGTVTVTTTFANGVTYSVFYVTGANGGLDKTNSTVGASATSVSLATGTLTTPNQIIFGSSNTANNSPGTFTQASGFTQLTAWVSSTSSYVAYDIVSSTTTVTFAPSWTTARNVSAAIASFKATPSGSVGSVSASAATSGVGAATAAGVATVSASVTASGVGAAKAASTATTAPAVVASGIGASVAAALGAIAIVGAATGIGAATAVSSASAAAGVVASGVGASVAASTGSASAAATAGGAGTTIAAAVGSATITGAATGAGTGVHAAVGSIRVAFTVTGLSPTFPALPWRSRVDAAPLTAPKLDDDLVYLLGLRVSTATTVGALVPNSPQGLRAFVTDATSTTFGDVVAGGGSNAVPVWSDGANWRIG